jgi:Nucleotidyl transferase AbiEii toxin, Type IV TA system
VSNPSVSLLLAEKDFYVVKALAAIAAVDNKEALHVRLVFGGGTALSRAHRLIRRMSEARVATIKRKATICFQNGIVILIVSVF